MIQLTRYLLFSISSNKWPAANSTNNICISIKKKICGNVEMKPSMQYAPKVAKGLCFLFGAGLTSLVLKLQ